MEIIPLKELKEVLNFNKGILSFLNSFLLPFLKKGELYTHFASINPYPGLPTVDAILNQLQIKVEVNTQELRHIPAQGPFIAIANHPFGGLEDLLLLKILVTARPDFKMMTNPALMKISNLQDYIIPVNPLKMHYQENIPGMRKALSLLQNDIPIGIFPAGEVSHLKDTEEKKIDSQWHPGLAGLLTKAQVPVLPIYITRNNNLIFNLLGGLKTSGDQTQLPNELINKEALNIKIRIGGPILYNDLASFPSSDLISYLRAKTYALGGGFLKLNPLSNFVNTLPAAKPIIPETAKTILMVEINGLPSRCLLFTHQQYQVYVASYKQIPSIMRELSRLREITFRAAGEGTNQAMDSDVYDKHYHHLFVYDTKANLLVGAYRIGKGKEILNQFGKSGFYLHSLFKIKKEFTPILKKSLEIGRAFVRPEYQQKPLAWCLLWEGIATFLEGKTNYCYLLGPVSISDYFSASSKGLMVDFMEKHFSDYEFAKLISPRKKIRFRVSSYYAEGVMPKNIPPIKSLDDLIMELKPKHLWLPVLLKKYLQQHVRIIGFNAGAKSSKSLNGLLMMDIYELRTITQNLLDKFSQAK